MSSGCTHTLVPKANLGHKTHSSASGKAVKELPLFQHTVHPGRKEEGKKSLESLLLEVHAQKLEIRLISRNRYFQAREKAPALSPQGQTQRRGPDQRARPGEGSGAPCPSLPRPGQRPSAVPWPESLCQPRGGAQGLELPFPRRPFPAPRAPGAAFRRGRSPSAPARPRTALPATPVAATCCRRACGGKSRAEAAPREPQPGRATRPRALLASPAAVPAEGRKRKGTGGRFRAETRPGRACTAPRPSPAGGEPNRTPSLRHRFKKVIKPLFARNHMI